MRKLEMAEARKLATRIAGVILIVVGLLLVAFTEHADRLRAMGEDALGGFVLQGDEAQPGPASDGQLVFVSGPVQVGQPARDAQFNVGVDAVALVRKVEMFQWHEVSGTIRSYDLDWVDHPVDSSKFLQVSGHENPGAFPFQRERFDSPDVRVGGFKLGPKLVDGISGVEDFTPDLHGLPANMAASFQIYDDALVTSVRPGQPRVGDLRVSWMEIVPKTLTVLARAQGGELVETPDASGHPLAQVQIGNRSLSDVVPDAAPRPRFAWARRVLALLLAWLGVTLLLPGWRDRGAAVLLAFVPLAVLAAAFWFGVRNITAGVLLAFAALASFGAFLRWQSMVPRPAGLFRKGNPP
ncbi:MAG TPA: TMEM43 family protein, partial [Rhodanobacteraceae bacterium]|nr:TMEM43 family protein [Rhodanobacteraceae bacterium]